MTESIQIIFGLFIIFSVAFYIIVFILLYRISNRLKETAEVSPLRKNAPLEFPRKNKQDESVDRLENRIRNAEREQEKARSNLRRNATDHRMPFQNKNKSYEDAGQPRFQGKEMNRPAKPQNTQPRPNPIPQHHPIPKPVEAAATVSMNPLPASAPKVQAETPRTETIPNEIRHGRRVQIKRRKFNAAEDAALQTEKTTASEEPEASVEIVSANTEPAVVAAAAPDHAAASDQPNHL